MCGGNDTGEEAYRKCGIGLVYAAWSNIQHLSLIILPCPCLTIVHVAHDVVDTMFGEAASCRMSSQVPMSTQKHLRHH